MNMGHNQHLNKTLEDYMQSIVSPSGIIFLSSQLTDSQQLVEQS